MSFTEDITDERIELSARTMFDGLYANYQGFVDGTRPVFESIFVVPTDSMPEPEDLTHEIACLMIHETAFRLLLSTISAEQDVDDPTKYRSFGGVVLSIEEITFGNDVDYKNLIVSGAKSD